VTNIQSIIRGKEMTEDEAVKFMAAKMGRMQLLCGSENYRIMVDLGILFNGRNLPFFHVAVYGETPNEVMKNAVKLKFGEDFVATANELKKAEEIKAIGFVRRMEKRFPELPMPDGYYERLINF
jgi:hypothetical protein